MTSVDPEGPQPGRSDLRAWLAFLAALASYVLLGVREKSLVLNWIVGPLYLLFAVHVIPSAVRRIGRRLLR